MCSRVWGHVPRALDAQQLTITHSPTQRIDFNNAKQGFPAFDPAAFLANITNLIKDATGIDLSSPEAFISSLIDVATTGGPAIEFAGALLDMIGTGLGFPPGTFKNLMQFLPTLLGGLDLTALGSPAAAWTAIISTFINPLGVFVNTDEFFAGLTGSGGGIPSTVPLLIPEAVAAVTGALRNLLKMLGSPNLGAGFDPVTAIQKMITDALKPSGLLASLEGGVLPDSQAPNLLKDLIDRVTALLPKVSTTPTGNIVLDFFNVIAGILGISSGAQSAAVTSTSLAAQNAAHISALAVGGTSGGTMFDGPSSTALPAPFVQFSLSGPYGAGLLGLDGQGHAYWYVGSGGVAKTQISVYTGATYDGLHQMSSMVTMSSVLSGSYLWLLARCTSSGTIAGTSFVYGRVGAEGVKFGYWVGGTDTPLTGWLPYTATSGEFWEFYAGTPASPNEWLIKQNNAVVATLPAAVGVAAAGVTGVMPAFAASAADLFFWSQIPPPLIDSFSYADTA